MEYLAILTGLEKAKRGIEEPVGDDAPKSMEDLILNCNPFLEAFGNAKTNMNDNSSRFGKFIKMLYNSSMICGGAMEQYLLEKARLVFQGPGERNYHVFYFLAKGMTPEEKTKLGLKDPEEVTTVLTYFLTTVLTYLRNYLLTYLLTYLLLPFLPACLPACLPSFLPSLLNELTYLL